MLRTPASSTLIRPISLGTSFSAIEIPGSAFLRPNSMRDARAGAAFEGQPSNLDGASYATTSASGLVGPHGTTGRFRASVGTSFLT